MDAGEQCRLASHNKWQEMFAEDFGMERMKLTVRMNLYTYKTYNYKQCIIYQFLMFHQDLPSLPTTVQLFVDP